MSQMMGSGERVVVEGKPTFILTATQPWVGFMRFVSGSWAESLLREILALESAL